MTLGIAQCSNSAFRECGLSSETLCLKSIAKGPYHAFNISEVTAAQYSFKNHPFGH